jgi:serine-type D-Ala-D-Ala carboxypeptidase
MCPELDQIAHELVIRPRVAPGAALAVAALGPRGWRFAAGASGSRSFRDDRPIGTRSIFDLASVTKPFVAATLARLVRKAALAFETPLGALLPELGDTPSAGVPLELFLSHRAGLDAHRSLFVPLVRGLPVDRAACLREAALARRADCKGPPPTSGFPPLYSDLGYLLLGEAIQRATGRALECSIEDEVMEPLGLRVHSASIWLGSSADFSSRVVPTEHVRFRGGEIAGVVHDENAWALAGHGSAGHAGLFGEAESVARFGAALLDALRGADGRWLGEDDLLRLVRERPGGSLRAGFDGKALEGSLAGERCGARTFGHLGFTGTSLWCDPDAGAAVVLLTNRVNPTRDRIEIRNARPGVHDALFAFAERLRAGADDGLEKAGDQCKS